MMTAKPWTSSQYSAGRGDVRQQLNIPNKKYIIGQPRRVVDEGKFVPRNHILNGVVVVNMSDAVTVSF